MSICIGTARTDEPYVIQLLLSAATSSTGIKSQLQRTPPSPVLQRSVQTATQSTAAVVDGGRVVVMGPAAAAAAAATLLGLAILFLMFTFFIIAFTGIKSQLQSTPPSPLLQRSVQTETQSIAVVRLTVVVVVVVVVLSTTAASFSAFTTTSTGIKSQLQSTPPSPVLHRSSQTASQSVVVDDVVSAI